VSKNGSNGNRDNDVGSQQQQMQVPSSAEATVQIWVEDSGPGIPEEKKGQLFAKFQDSLDSLSQGTGLGLSLCLVLVRLLGGDIWLDETYCHSHDCPGARFIVDLGTPPLLCDSVFDDDVEAPSVMLPSGADSTQSTCDSSGANHCGGDNKILEGFPDSIGDIIPVGGAEHLLPPTLNVLFVDDDTVLRRLFIRAVRRIRPDWTIQEAASGEAALRLVDESCSFDLIFMDQYMASTEKQLLGTETTRALRSKGVRAIICGLSANEMGNDFFSAGASAFVCKPLPARKEILEQILTDLLFGATSEYGRKISSLVTLSQNS
jgi:CheY-like chemotaxis protein